MTSQPSRKQGHHSLAPSLPKRAETMLMSLANVPGEWPLIDDVVAYTRTMAALERARSRHADAFEDCPAIPLLVIRDLLRKAWTAPDLRQQEWYLFRARHLHKETVHRVRRVQEAAKSSAKLARENPTIPGTLAEAVMALAQSEPPPLTSFEEAAAYMQRNLHRVLYCPGAECPAPYFFRKKKGQRYCTDACAVPAMLAGKRRWWTENRAKSKRR
jgi:hypothetical protein